MNKLYIQYSSYDPNEFDSFDRISTYEIQAHFEKYPWTDENDKIKNLKEQSASPSLTIINSAGDEIAIYVFGDENLKFNCQYRLNKGIVKRTKIALAFDSKEIIELIGKFCNESRRKEYLKILESKEIVEYKLFIDILATIFPGKKKQKSRLLSNTETTFEVTNWRIISKSFFTISFLFMAPVIMGLVFINTGKEFNLRIFLIMQVVLSIPAIPGFLILASYIKENRSMILKFKRRNNIFTITQNNKVVEIDKGEIEKVICHESNAGNAPWTSFDYAEINLKDGNKIYLTNLLIPSDKLINHISNVEYEYKKRWIPKIKY